MSEHTLHPDEPVNAPTAEESPDRRGFLKVAVGGMCLAYAAAIGYPVYRYLNSPVERSIAEAAVTEVDQPGAEKLPKGSAMMFKFGAKPSLLIHHEDDTWVAMTAVCTHLGCTVAYRVTEKDIHCACHGGKYDAKTGQNIAGPPPKPLKTYEIVMGEGKLTVKRS